MADTKISQLPAATTPLSGAEVVPLVQSGATVQTPVNEISKLTAATANTFTANQIISVTDNTNAALRVTQLGTGLALRIEDETNPDSTPVVVDNIGRVGVGTTSPASLFHMRFDVDGTTRAIVQNRNGSGTPLSEMSFISGGFDITDLRYAYIQSGGGSSTYLSFGTGAGVTPTERFKIDANGNVLVTGPGGLGYGTGSGGAVTQITSRTTSVTLNKTNGAVTLFTAAGVTGSWTTFQVLNSTVAATDTVVVSVKTGATNTYIASVPSVSAGNFSITFISLAGTASDAPVINFAVIKAVTA